MDKTRDEWLTHGHPSLEELIAAQATKFPADPKSLRGRCWPEDESIDEFLDQLREWRGHKKSDPAA